MVGELFDKGTIYAGDGDQHRSTELSDTVPSSCITLLSFFFAGESLVVGMLVGQDCRQNWLPEMEHQTQESGEQWF